MGGVWDIMDLLILGCGFYALYSAYVLKTQGKIIKTFLVFKDTDVNSCKNLPEYVNLMAPKLYALGGIMVAYGVVSLINSYLVNINGLYMTFIVIFTLALIWYGIAVSKALKSTFELDIFFTECNNVTCGKNFIFPTCQRKKDNVFFESVNEKKHSFFRV